MIGADLRLGRWQDCLADVDAAHAIISDPPFSARTEEGYRSGNSRATVDYGHLTRCDVEQFVSVWHLRCRCWVVLFTDHVCFPWWESLWTKAGWYTFPPVFWLRSAPPPRFQGDGPSTAGDLIFVARPRRTVRDRWHRPGAYRAAAVRESKLVGAKDVHALVEVVSDYTRPGDLVVDPFAGTAAIGVACVRTGRRYVGAEVVRTTWNDANERLMTAEADDGPAPDRARERAERRLRRLRRRPGVVPLGRRGRRRAAVRCASCGWRTKRVQGPCSHDYPCRKLADCNARYGRCLQCDSLMLRPGTFTASSRAETSPIEISGTTASTETDR